MPKPHWHLGTSRGPCVAHNEKRDQIFQSGPSYSGAAGRNRTHDPLVRSQVLYPAELQPPEARIIAGASHIAKAFIAAAQLERHLLPRLDRQVLLVSDPHGAYRSFARKHGIAHQAVNLRAGVRVRRGVAGAIHVQNVNAYHQRFRQWLSRFRGVASRYLPNYLGWRRALDGGRITTVEQLLRIAIGVIHS